MGLNRLTESLVKDFLKGENQTINQENIYGKHVRNYNDIGLPSKNLSLLQKKID